METRGCSRTDFGDETPTPPRVSIYALPSGPYHPLDPDGTSGPPAAAQRGHPHGRVGHTSRVLRAHINAPRIRSAHSTFSRVTFHFRQTLSSHSCNVSTLTTVSSSMAPSAGARAARRNVLSSHAEGGKDEGRHLARDQHAQHVHDHLDRGAGVGRIDASSLEQER